MAIRPVTVWVAIVSALTSWSTAAWAADPPSDPKPEETKPSEAAVSANAEAAHTSKDPHDPYEDPHNSYRFIGLRFREVVVPKFMINLFADGGATVSVPMFGPVFSSRRDHIEYDFAIQYADYSMKQFMFKSHSDGEESYEIVSSSMKLLYFEFDLLYDIPIDKSGRFSFLVGGGVGLAPVFGNLYRNQAVPLDRNNVNPNDVTKWKACAAPGKPGTTSKATGEPFCDPSNSHYGNYDEPSWAHGGSKPSLFPWISLPQLSLRYKPAKELETRLDIGFSITGFFVGFSAAYGL